MQLIQTELHDEEMFAVEDLRKEDQSLQPGNSPDLDGIRNESLKRIIDDYPEKPLNLSEPVEEAKVNLIEKG